MCIHDESRYLIILIWDDRFTEEGSERQISKCHLGRYAFCRARGSNAS